MWFDRKFSDAVQELNVAEMGTEVMAPFLYSLIRFTRPRHVLEGGMGHTSLFIAKALSDNVSVFENERRALLEKTELYLADIENIGAAGRQSNGMASATSGLHAIYGPKQSRLADRRTQWMFAEPSFTRPEYYAEPHRPHLYCVDNLAMQASSAHRVTSAIDRLGLRPFVTVDDGDFWSCEFVDRMQSVAPFDLIWVDLDVSVANLSSLTKGRHWQLLNGNGGMLLVHCMLTTRAGQVLVEEMLKREQKKRFREFELIGLLEPNRVLQNNCVVIRKITALSVDPVDSLFTSITDSVFEHEAGRLVRGIAERPTS